MRAAQLLMPLALALLIAGAPVQTAAGGVGWDVTKSRKYKSIDEKIEMLVLESDYEVLELRYERRVQWLISYLATLPRDSVQYKAVQKERMNQNAETTSVLEAQQARAPLGGSATRTGDGDVSEPPRPVCTGTEAYDEAPMMSTGKCTKGDCTATGYGRWEYVTGDVYDGEWEHDPRGEDGVVKDSARGLKHGRGTYTHASGETYVGDWADGSQHGRGKATSPGGTVYEGDWADGIKHGRGKYTWADGGMYEGDWVAGKQHGRGKYTMASGTVYEGDFANNDWHGRGKYISASGVYEGDFVAGKQHGRGKATFGSDMWHDGQWSNGKPVKAEL